MASKIDLTGQKINMLFVIHETEPHIFPSGKKRTMWLCLCDCGNYTNVSTQSLIQETTKSCGCFGKQQRSKARFAKIEELLLGKQIGRWNVDNYAGQLTQPGGQTRSLWNCTCECGTKAQLTTNQLTGGNSLSCGCLRRELTSKRELIDLRGKEFPNYVVIGRIENIVHPNGSSSTAWLCQCCCENLFVSTTQRILENRTNSCGCKRYKYEDITGFRFGMLVAMYRNEDTKLWVCKCDCGTIKEFSIGHLKAGNIYSCGCYKSSVGEKSVKEYLDANKIKYKKEYWFDELRSYSNMPLRFDFAILDQNKNPIALIEYQGKQHFIDTDFGRQQREITDQMKKDFCISVNIPLFEIRYDEDINTACDKIIQQSNYLYANTVPSSQETA